MKQIFILLSLFNLAVSQTFKIDIQRPQYDAITTSGLSGVGFASYELNAPRWTAGVEAGYSYLRYTGQSAFTLSNTRVYISTPPNRKLSLRYSLFLPSVQYDNNARAAGLASNFVTRPEAFLSDAIMQRLEISGTFDVPFEIEFKFSCGLTPIVSVGENRILVNDFELLAPFTLGIVDTKDALSLGAWLEGNYIASEPRVTFAEATAMQARLEAGYRLGKIVMAAYAILPVDNEVGDVLKNSVGLKMKLGL